MYFNKLVNTILNENDTLVTYTGSRLGYQTKIIICNDGEEDDKTYPYVLPLTEIKTKNDWDEFERVVEIHGEDEAVYADGVLTVYVGKKFEQAYFKLNDYLAKYSSLQNVLKPYINEVNKLSDIQGTFILYENGFTDKPYINFAIELNIGVYKKQHIQQNLQNADTSGLEDLL
jgi:hypothetical protein